MAALSKANRTRWIFGKTVFLPSQTLSPPRADVLGEQPVQRVHRVRTHIAQQGEAGYEVDDEKPSQE